MERRHHLDDSVGYAKDTNSMTSTTKKSKKKIRKREKKGVVSQKLLKCFNKVTSCLQKDKKEET
jgi:hypothetical protein